MLEYIADFIRFVFSLIFSLIFIILTPLVGAYLAGGWGFVIGIILSCGFYVNLL